MSSLVPCSTCRRHVRRTETACPFCAAELPRAASVPAARAPLPVGTKRAAVFAMGVTLAASACEPDNAVPIYGAPWMPEAGSSGAGGGDPAGNGGSGSGGRNANGGRGGTETADAPDADAPDADAPDAAGRDAAP